MVQGSWVRQKSSWVRHREHGVLDIWAWVSGIEVRGIRNSGQRCMGQKVRTRFSGREKEKEA